MKVIDCKRGLKVNHLLRPSEEFTVIFMMLNKARIKSDSTGEIIDNVNYSSITPLIKQTNE